MKKKIVIVLAVLLGSSALGLGISQSSASQTEPKLSFDKIEQLVKDQYPGEITDWELEKDRNKAVYEVEIRNNDKEYNIKLDGNTGEILELEEQRIADEAEQSKNDTAANKADDSTSKKDNKTKENNDKKSGVSIKENNDSAKENNKDSKNDDNSNGTKLSERTAIDPSKAKQIAQKAFKGSIISMDLDEDDGKRIYEVEMKSKNKEAEIEIDAYTGEVIVLSIDTDDDEVVEDKDDDHENKTDDHNHDRDHHHDDDDDEAKEND